MKNKKIKLKSFFSRSCKGELDGFMKIALWIAVFALLAIAMSYAIKSVIS